MLRITLLPDLAALRFEGNLAGPWVAEAREACQGWFERGEPHLMLRIDLQSVAFVDSAGLKLLRELESRGVELRPCSPFVHQLLAVEFK